MPFGHKSTSSSGRQHSASSHSLEMRLIVPTVLARLCVSEHPSLRRQPHTPRLASQEQERTAQHNLQQRQVWQRVYSGKRLALVDHNWHEGNGEMDRAKTARSAQMTKRSKRLIAPVMALLIWAAALPCLCAAHPSAEGVRQMACRSGQTHNCCPSVASGSHGYPVDSHDSESCCRFWGNIACVTKGAATASISLPPLTLPRIQVVSPRPLLTATISIVSLRGPPPVAAPTLIDLSCCLIV